MTKDTYYTTIRISDHMLHQTWILQDVKLVKDDRKNVELRLRELFDILVGATDLEIVFT